MLHGPAEGIVDKHEAGGMALTATGKAWLSVHAMVDGLEVAALAAEADTDPTWSLLVDRVGVA